MKWNTYHGRTQEDLGFLPAIILEDDPRPVRDQIQERYAHGGGWYPMAGFRLVTRESGEFVLAYPGDPDLLMVASATLRGEIIMLFEADFIVVLQHPAMTFEVSRID